MNEISIGAVGAAAIAALVSLLGLIIAKEQKVSEFRQAWIDELRKCFVAYLVSINAISDSLRQKNSGIKIDDATLLANYKALNEANHGIKLRVNGTEEPAKQLLNSMTEFEKLAEINSSLTPEKIRIIEIKFIENSKDLLKFEWKRVKRGEKIFVITKRIVYLIISFALIIFTLSLFNNKEIIHKNSEKYELLILTALVEE